VSAQGYAARVRRLALFALAALAVLAPAAAAAPECPGGPFATRTLATAQGTLESAIVHPNGSLYFTNESSLLRMKSPGAKPEVLTEAEAPGGLAIEPDGTIVMGVGNSIPNGTMGDQTGPSSLIRIDPETGKSEPYATGLSMGNGVDRGPDGAIYASNDFGSNIDRIVDGQTERGWAHVQSGNGLQVDSTGKWLYVNQTFQPAAIQRVEIANPQNVTPFAVAPPEDASAGFDGMDRDPLDSLYVAANGAGSIWKVTPEAEMCVLVSGLPAFPDGPSAVAVGLYGTQFPPENLYVVAFNGDVTEIAGVAETGDGPKLRLSVRPRRVTAGTRRRFRAKVTAGGEPVQAATVRLAGREATTNERGRATLRPKFRRAGKRRAVASKGGYRPARKTVRVTGG
jgi:sugar lactone lactonase YvrE